MIQVEIGGGGGGECPGGLWHGGLSRGVFPG